MTRGAIRAPRRNVFDATTLRKATVSEASRNRYQQSRASVEQRGFAFTVAGLKELLYSDCELTQMAQIKAALKHEMMVAGSPISQEEDDELNILIKGRGRLMPTGTKVPGALTFKMVEQFLAWYRDRPRTGRAGDWSQEMEDAMWIHYGAALRAFQLSKLTLDDLLYNKSTGGWSVNVRRKGAISEEDRETKDVLESIWPKMDSILRRVLARHVKSRGAEDPSAATSKIVMFPKWTEERFNGLLKEAAAPLKFDLTLRWSSHGGRHGGLTDAMEIGGAEYAQRVGGQKKGAETYGYTRPNQQRVAEQLVITSQNAKRSREITALATKKRPPVEAAKARKQQTRLKARTSKRSRR
jgi:hypothetical protein